jgi:hypothetical protein
MLTLILLIAALVCFLIAAGGVAVGRVNLIALGLAFWVITLLIAAVPGADA